MLGTLENAFFYFIFYSMLGWVYETVLCSLEAGKAVNRGFLNGPYLPIYGIGAISFIVLLGRVNSPLFIFLFGAIVACTIEYVTSVALEKAFGARWWDYSKQKYNLSGRICLGAGTMFGLFAVVLVKFMHPMAYSVFSKLPPMLFDAVSIAAVILFTADLVITLKGMKGFPRKRVEKELMTYC